PLISIDMDRISQILSISGVEDPGLLISLIDLYIEELTLSMGQLSKTSQSGDMAELTHTAHRLKGSSLNLGVNSVADICKKIEEGGRAGNAPDLPVLIREL